MIDCTDIADFIWLTGDEARAILAELASDTAPLHSAVSRLRGKLSAACTHLVIEQVDLRRRAAAKFTQADQMFFTRVGLEQATDEWIAHYKASRLVQRAWSVSDRSVPMIADLCSGIGGDLTALAKIGTSRGIDLNSVAAHFAAINSGACVETIDVAKFDVRDVAAWHIDPDRRSTGHRTTTLEYCQPDLATIEGLRTINPHAAIKLAPATKVPADWISHCELEWISRDRECRQQVAWHGNLALTPGLHRATIVPDSPPRYSGEGLGEGSSTPRTLTGAPDEPMSLTNNPDEYIFDTDPAVRAARLTGALAAEHGLAALSAGPTYLTGPCAITDEALACFQVGEVLPLRVHTLSAHLRERGVGSLEIKTRGVDVNPDKLRRQLKLRGDNATSLLIANIARRPVAILAHRVQM